MRWRVPPRPQLLMDVPKVMDQRLRHVNQIIPESVKREENDQSIPLSDSLRNPTDKESQHSVCGDPDLQFQKVECASQECRFLRIHPTSALIWKRIPHH
jgi:hypothetical protein